MALTTNTLIPTDLYQPQNNSSRLKDVEVHAWNKEQIRQIWYSQDSQQMSPIHCHEEDAKRNEIKRGNKWTNSYTT